MSLVFQNIDPPPPSPPGEFQFVPPAFVGVEDTLAWRRGGGSIFWKTRDIGLPSYSNNLSTGGRLNVGRAKSNTRCRFNDTANGNPKDSKTVLIICLSEANYPCSNNK
jgi:hypothetical protein